MNKNPLIRFLIIVVVGGYFIAQVKANQTPKTFQFGQVTNASKNQPGNTAAHSSITPPLTDTNYISPQDSYPIVEQNSLNQQSWNTYTNSKLGFNFQYPSTWRQQGKDVEVVNLGGTVTMIEINFIDTASTATLLIQYHLPPNGANIYRYVVSQYNTSQGLYATGGKQIKIAGNNAIQASTTINVDGKGNALNPQLRLIIVDFLDKKQTGEIQLQFKTPLPNGDVEIGKLNKLFSTFNFTKN